jgi:hypothetical protein
MFNRIDSSYIQSLLIKCKHIGRIPISRIFLKIKHEIVKKFIFRQKIAHLIGNNTIGLVRFDDRFLLIFEEIKTFKEPSSDFFTINGFSKYLNLRGQKIETGDLTSFDWSLLIDPPEEKLNCYYELSYMSIFVQSLDQSDSLYFESLAEILEALEGANNSYDWWRSLAWTPVSCANRLINLCAILFFLHRNNVCEKNIVSRIYRHAEICFSIVVRLCEYHLHYNHLLFCKVSAFVFDALIGKVNPESIGYIIRIAKEQILPDGGHSERSPTYHLHVLYLVKLVYVYPDMSVEHKSELYELVSKMKSALEVFTHLDGDIALFNDSALFDAPHASLFLHSQHSDYLIRTLTETGYSQINSGAIRIILDGGVPGPADNPGHGHCDYLSIEASIGSRRFIVDPGCASYVPGKLRNLTRSGNSHNGPRFAVRELMQMCGAFRVGSYSCSLIKEVKHRDFGTVVISSCKPYFDESLLLKRLVFSHCVGQILIIDVLAGSQPATSKFIISKAWTRQNEFTYLNDGIVCEVKALFGTILRSDNESYWPTGPGNEIQSEGFLVTLHRYNGFYVSIISIADIRAHACVINANYVDSLLEFSVQDY